ncbi:unnamed protein product [Zymoseptoria tritici ST99CH_3D7]|uniref:Uncharacterized protein n=1 Tax=Zymoseptoria tritici (strain ST99CH_3D7) TaxID=1276538 RepID=A0A1X7RN59_ZYMT9|nr:unnamed protein product [Zymoseptoria tritici ST99CH_3D7]
MIPTDHSPSGSGSDQAPHNHANHAVCNCANIRYDYSLVVPEIQVLQERADELLGQVKAFKGEQEEMGGVMVGDGGEGGEGVVRYADVLVGDEEGAQGKDGVQTKGKQIKIDGYKEGLSTEHVKTLGEFMAEVAETEMEDSNANLAESRKFGPDSKATDFTGEDVDTKAKYDEMSAMVDRITAKADTGQDVGGDVEDHIRAMKVFESEQRVRLKKASDAKTKAASTNETTTQKSKDSGERKKRYYESLMERIEAYEEDVANGGKAVRDALERKLSDDMDAMTITNDVQSWNTSRIPALRHSVASAQGDTNNDPLQVNFISSKEYGAKLSQEHTVESDATRVPPAPDNSVKAKQFQERKDKLWQKLAGWSPDVVSDSKAEKQEVITDEVLAADPEIDADDMYDLKTVSTNTSAATAFSAISEHDSEDHQSMTSAELDVPIIEDETNLKYSASTTTLTDKNPATMTTITHAALHPFSSSASFYRINPSMTYSIPLSTTDKTAARTAITRMHALIDLTRAHKSLLRASLAMRVKVDPRDKKTLKLLDTVGEGITKIRAGLVEVGVKFPSMN